jgi:uncharacterized protein
MDTQDRKAIEGLFTKLDEVERGAGPRDADAERFISERISRQPGAPYYMAQTIVMQEMALENAQRELEALRRGQDARAPEGGLLGRLFGGGGSDAARRTPGARGGAAPSGAWGNTSQHTPSPAAYGQPQARGGGGGFLAGAAQTAMGVAGGVLLGNAIGGMFAGNDASAQTADAGAADEPQVEDAAYDDGGGDDFGGDEI